MYRNAYQRGMLTVFFSCGSKPLAIWDTHMQDGYITRFLDQDIKSMVLEIGGNNVSTTYITCPKGNVVLGITMPFLVMIVKNLKKYFSFEVTILDETGTRRRFRASNFQSSTQILPLCTVMPIGLSEGWNQIQFNLSEFTRRAYKKQFVEVQKLKINANIRLRRVYFAERLIPEEELPPEYKLFFPLASKGKKGKAKLGTEEPSASQKPQETEGPVIAEDISDKRKGSQVEMAKSSKTSIHSVKPRPSKEEIRGSKTQVEVIPEVAEDQKESAPTQEEQAAQNAGTTEREVADATEEGQSEEAKPIEEIQINEEATPAEEVQAAELLTEASDSAPT